MTTEALEFNRVAEASCDNFRENIGHKIAEVFDLNFDAIDVSDASDAIAEAADSAVPDMYHEIAECLVLQVQALAELDRADHVGPMLREARSLFVALHGELSERVMLTDQLIAALAPN